MTTIYGFYLTGSGTGGLFGTSSKTRNITSNMTNTAAPINIPKYSLFLFRLGGFY